MGPKNSLPKELLRIENRLNDVLQPVQPRTGFIEELRIELDEEMVQKMKSKKVKTGLLLAGGIVGVAVMVITLIKSIMTWPKLIQSITGKLRKRPQIAAA